MKKDLPYAFPIKIRGTIEDSIAASIYMIECNLENGYRITLPDAAYYLACKYTVAQDNNKQFSGQDQKYFSPTEVKIFIIKLKIDRGKQLTNEEQIFYFEFLKQRYNERIKIIKKEINKTIDNEKRIKTLYISDYRRLLTLAKDFDQVTLINWFIPIYLDFKAFVHIYVRHVDETKFGIRNSKPRSFFNYKYDLIFKLLRKVLETDRENIENHFLEVEIAIGTNNELGKRAKYFKGKKGIAPIEYNGDKFALEIESNGRIASFYQLYTATPTQV